MSFAGIEKPLPVPALERLAQAPGAKPLWGLEGFPFPG